MCSGKQLNGLIRNELAALVLIRLTVDGEIQKHFIDKHIPTNEEEFTEEI